MENKLTPKSISFKGYKCFKEESTIPWFAPFNVIIGRNNSGKSSFIDIIHSLCDANFRASISRNIDITLTYTIDNFEYFDIDNLATQIYGYRGYALQYFGNHFMNKEFHVNVNLKKCLNYYANSYDVNKDELSDRNCSIKIKKDVTIGPFNNSDNMK